MPIYYEAKPKEGIHQAVLAAIKMDADRVIYDSRVYYIRIEAVESCVKLGVIPGGVEKVVRIKHQRRS